MTQGKLPLPWTEFIGRERERVSLKRLLTRARLATVVGLCGVGKSRLALQVIEDLQPEFGGRIWFVPCDELTDAADILAVVQAEGSGRGASERDEAGEKSANALISAVDNSALHLRGLRPGLIQAGCQGVSAAAPSCVATR